MTTAEIQALTNYELYLLARHGIFADDRTAAIAEQQRRENEGDEPGEGNAGQWR